ncbi:MAG: hypothetical protein QNJ97_29335 [Myxococcota bacterium]|nr:hypothetical protein [Myxococcota bacterium]
MTSNKWARVAQDEAFGLRRGAWYPVVGDPNSSLVVLDVNKTNRPVNRTNLQFTDEKPQKWSVVRRQPEEGAAVLASSKELGPVYGVCPVCRWRVKLGPEDTQETCPECGETSEVDWDHPC